MKYVLLAFAFLLIIPSVFAASFNLSESYAQKETILTPINGYFTESIRREQVGLWRNNVQVPFEYDFKKMGSTYYLGFTTPQNPHNYTLKISEIYTIVQGQAATVTLESNFSVTNESAPYSFRPVLVETNDTFTLRVLSNEDSLQEIIIGAPYNRAYNILPGETTLELSIDPLASGANLVRVGYTSIMAYNLRSSSSVQGDEIVTDFFRITPSRVETILLPGTGYSFPIRILNTGPTEIRTIHIQLNESLFSTQGIPSRIKANASAEFNVTLKKVNQSVDDVISVQLGNETIDLGVAIRYEQPLPLINNSNNATLPQANYFCRELNGKICQGGEVCQGTITTARDGSCCLSTCELPPAPSYSWIGYVLGTLLLIVLTYVGFRYYRTKKQGLTTKLPMDLKKP